MAVTMNLLTSANDVTDATVFTTASISPADDALVILICMNDHATVAQTITPTGGGMTTWTSVQSIDVAGGGKDQKFQVFRALQSSPGTAAVSLTMGAECLHAGWIIVEFLGVDTGGTNGADAIVQSVKSAGGTGEATAPSLTLAAFGSANNATAGFMQKLASGVVTPGTGFEEIAENNHSLATVQAQWRNDNDTSVDCSWSLNQTYGFVAMEIKAGAVVSPTGAAGHLGINLGW